MHGARAPVYIYWANNVGSTLGRANLNGTDPNENFIEDFAGGELGGVAVYGGHIYWSGNGTIGRANLNGTDVDPHFITTGGTWPWGVAIYGGHIYWADCCGSGDSIVHR